MEFVLFFSSFFIHSNMSIHRLEYNSRGPKIAINRPIKFVNNKLRTNTLPAATTDPHVIANHNHPESKRNRIKKCNITLSTVRL